jgi:hypothetical protein
MKLQIGIGHPDDLMIINNSLNPSILGSVGFSSLRLLDLILATLFKGLRLIFAVFWPYFLGFILGSRAILSFVPIRFHAN